jgi:hypothetical protein
MTVDRLIFLLRLLIHIIELLADMTGGPYNRDQETCNKPVKQVD